LNKWGKHEDAGKGYTIAIIFSGEFYVAIAR